MIISISFGERYSAYYNGSMYRIHLKVKGVKHYPSEHSKLCLKDFTTYKCVFNFNKNRLK